MNIRRVIGLGVTAGIVAAVVGFFYWTVGSPRIFAGPQGDYYNLLVDGFRGGHLAMKVTPDPWLGLDSTKVKGYLLDASFYHGRYFLYFGVAPALLLFWPWAAATGQNLPEPLAAMLLASAAFALSVGWLRALRRSFFPQVGGSTWAAAVLLLGLGTGYAVVLRRPMFYEIAIFSGVAATLGCLWCLTLALCRAENAGRWLALASACAGLAAASRPTLIPGAVLAVGSVALAIGRRGRRSGAPVRLLAAAAGPLGLMLAALAWYNWARFDNPFEFGLHYQVGSNGDGFPFTLGAIRENFREYYLNPPGWSWFFPFFTPGPRPAESYPEQVHGQFFWLPLFVVAAVFGVRALWRRGADAGLATIVGAAGLWAGTALLVVTMAPPHSNRYQLDFHPVFVVLTLVGLFACAEAGPRWRALARVAWAWAAVVVFFNVCTSFHVHGFFRAAHPAQFEALARVADRLVWPLQRLAGPRFGGVELAVKFPPAAPGTVEPLLVAGGGDELDALWIRYGDAGQGRIVFEHLRYGTVESDDFDLREGEPRWLKIQLGTLYPPPWHPWYESMPPGLARARHRVAVEIDGLKILDRDVDCFAASANQVRWGESGSFPGRSARFGGEIERVKGLKADLAWLNSLSATDGRYQLELHLPRDRYGAEEPLVFTGQRGTGELVSIQYVRDGVVRFASYHDGTTAPVTSPDIEWNYEEPLDVLVHVGSLQTKAAPAGANLDEGVAVEMDGRVVLKRTGPVHVAKPTEVYLGCIPWPVASCRLMFAGDLRVQRAEDPGQGAMRRARLTLLAGRAVEFKVAMPALAGGLPLVTTGIVGRGDGLFVEHLSASRVRFGLDHWGSQPLLSAPVPVEPGRTYVISVSLGARVSGTVTVPGHLEVRLDGKPVLDAPVDLFPAKPDQVFFGANPIGMSTSQPKFSGPFDLVDPRGR
ncbi:MAG TPA: hypothetical protein VL200_15455 [Lacunisphaera sp.]|nr:hypothetical protein [Lacunisphaera sp.]